MSVQKFIYSLFGPNVYRIHRSNDASQRAFNYSSNKLESRSQAVLNFLSTTKSILYYTTPLWLVFLYRRGYCCMETMTDLAKFGGCASALFVALLITRGIGRTMNNDYCQFLNILSDAKGSPKKKDKKKLLRGYDFDFNHWPYDFRWDDVESKTSWSKPPSFWRRIRSQHNNIVSTVLIGIPEEILAYVISHTFGISLTYPGSMKLLQAAYGSALQDNRAKLVEQSGGIRSKLIARDGNSIDTMFVDKRENGDRLASHHGYTLVICCEGNGGFYEVGCMCTPLQSGYSVLGWNHPGFAGSTGSPFPEAEKCAIDVVFQYAIHELKFQPENILVFAWSIGGFSALTAAIQYPDISGLILDATFYDILPFAKKMMPQFVEPIVTYTVRNYLNLHHSQLLCQYKGPVHFIRRTQDEVMNLDGQHRLDSNLGNQLIEDFFQARYPKLFETEEATNQSSEVLWSWFTAPDTRDRDEIAASWNLDAKECESIVQNYIFQHPLSTYPIDLGQDLSQVQKIQVLLYLVNKHVACYPSTHCTPLPPSYFTQPWKMGGNHQSGSDSANSSDFELINSQTVDY